MRKKLTYFFTIILVSFLMFFLTGFLKAFLDVPSSEFIEAKGYETTTKEAPTSGSPEDYSAKDNVAFLAYNAAHKNFSSVTTGTVRGSVAGIEQAQAVLNRRFVEDNVYIVETSSTGLISFAAQKYFNRDKNLVLIRDAVNPKDLAKGYKTNEPLPFSFQGFTNNYGWLPNQLCAYTICDETILNISDLKKLDNGDYEITIDLDTQYGVYYYRYEVRANAGVSAFPVFSKTNLTLTFSSDWTLKTLHSYEEYKNQAPGMGLWANCIGDLTEVFDFSAEKKEISSSDLAYFKGYEHLEPQDGADPIVKEANGFDYLMQAFSSYLTEPGYFDIAVNFNGTKFDLHLYLDLANNAYGVVSSYGTVYYDGSRIYLTRPNGDKFALTLGEINNPLALVGDLALTNTPFSDLSFDSLTDDIIDAITQGTISKTDNEITVTTNLNLLGFSLPLNFNYLNTTSGVKLVDINLKKMFFNRGIDLKFTPSELNVPTFDTVGFTDYTTKLNDLLEKFSGLLPSDLELNAIIDTLLSLKVNLLNILENNVLNASLTYEDKKLSINGSLYLEFKDDLKLEAALSAKYNSLAFDFKLFYLDGFVYLDTPNYLVKLTSDELFAFFTDLDFTALFSLIPSIGAEKLDLDFSVLKADDHNFMLSGFANKLAVNVSDTKLDAKFVVSEGKTLITYEDIAPYKQNIANILKTKVLNLNVNYVNGDLAVNANIYVDFNNNLKLALDLNLKYRALTLPIRVVYKEDTLYLEYERYLLKLTVSDLKDLATNALSVFSLSDLAAIFVDKISDNNINIKSDFKHLNSHNFTVSLPTYNVTVNVSDLPVAGKFDVDLTKNTFTYQDLECLLDFNEIKNLIGTLPTLVNALKPFAPSVQVQDMLINIYNAVKENIFNIIDNKTLSAKLTYTNGDLKVTSVLYLEFNNGLQVDLLLNFNYKNLAESCHLIYQDKTFYFVYDQYLIKLALADVKVLYSTFNEFLNPAIFTSLVNKDLPFYFIRISDKHSFLFGIDNFKLAVSDAKLTNRFVIPSDKTVITYQEISLYNENILNILKTKVLNVNVNYTKGDFTVTGNAYLDFNSDLKAELNLNLKYRALTIPLRAVYKEDTLYLEYERYLLKMTVSDFKDLAKNTLLVFNLSDLTDTLINTYNEQKQSILNLKFTHLDAHNFTVALSDYNVSLNLSDTAVAGKFNVDTTKKTFTYNDIKGLLDFTKIKDLTAKLPSLIEKVKPYLPTIDLQDDLIAIFNTLKENIFNIIDNKTVNITLTYTKRDLTITSDVYLDFKNDLKLDVLFNFNYKNLNKSARLIYQDKTFYFVYEDYLLQLTTTDLKDLYNTFKEFINKDNLKALLLKDFTINYTYNKIDDHQFTFNIEDVTLNVTDLTLTDRFTIPSDKTLVTYSDFLKYKDQIYNVLKNKRLDLNLTYKDQDLTVTALLYIDFYSDLKMRADVTLKYKDIDFVLTAIYKQETLYLDLGNVLVKLDHDDLINLTKKIFKKDNFDIYLFLDFLSDHSDLLDKEFKYTYSVLSDHAGLLTCLDQKLTLNLSDQFRDVSYNVPEHTNVISYPELAALVDAFYDFKDFYSDNKLTLSFAGDFATKDGNFTLTGFVTFDFKTFDFRLNVALFDHKNMDNHYLDVVYLNERFYFTYRTDLKSGNNLSITSSINELKDAIDKIIHAFKLESELKSVKDFLDGKSFSLHVNDLLDFLRFDVLTSDISIGIKYTLDDNPLNVVLTIGKEEGKYQNIAINPLTYTDYSLTAISTFQVDHSTIKTLDNVTYYAMSDLIPLLDALVDTAELHAWHIKGTVNVTMLGLVNLTLEYDALIKLPEGESEPQIELTLKVPIFLGVNDDQWYMTGDTGSDYSRVLRIYHDKDKTVFHRTGNIPWIGWFRSGTSIYERKYAVNNDQLQNNFTDLFLRYGLGLKDNIMSQIDQSTARTDRKPDYANSLKSLVYDKEARKYDATLNVGALADDKALKNLDLSLLINENNIVSNLAATMNIFSGVSITLKTTDMQLVDIGVPFDFSADYYNSLANHPYPNGEVWHMRDGKSALLATLS